MPELPEVQTTVNGLRRMIIGLCIADVWSDYDSAYFKSSDTIKNPSYFSGFKKKILGKKVIAVSRRAKNILIHLGGGKTGDPNGDIILVHMKMTGHLMYGTYRFDPRDQKRPWIPILPESLKDPFNRHIHFVITFSNKKRLALSDSRKFAKVTLIHEKDLHTSEHTGNIGPEPLEKRFTPERLRERLTLRPNGRIKQVLMDQKIIAGIGNIYADESLWRAGINPLERVTDITSVKINGLFTAIRKTLSRGIDLGGDSMSDYRNIHGEKGIFQEHHHAYRKTGMRCDKRACVGTVVRIVIGGRSAHFCDKHQKLLGKNKRR